MPVRFALDASRLADAPVIALDVDDLLAAPRRKQELTEIAALSSRYDFVGLVASDDHAAYQKKLQRHGLSIPLVFVEDRNPYVKGDGDANRLEALKELKFQQGVGVVGFYTDGVQLGSDFLVAGIQVLTMGDRRNFTDVVSAAQETLEGFHAAWTRARSSPDFALDGLTDSRVIPGNRIEFISTNDAALSKYRELIQSAHSFIHIENFELISDRVGRIIMAELLHRADEGVQIRIVLDELSIGMAGGDEGYSWLSQEDLEKMRDHPNIQLVFDDLLERPCGERPAHGLKSIYHRKWLLVDQVTDAGIELVALGGDRVLATVAFSDAAANAQSEKEFWRRNIIPGVGWHGFQDVSTVVRGPVTAEIHATFVRDFECAGGILPPVEREVSDLSKPQAGDSLDIRYISQDVKRDLNVTVALERLLSDPTARHITILTAFNFTPELCALLAQAAARDVEVTLVSGGLKYDFVDRFNPLASFFKLVSGEFRYDFPDRRHVLAGLYKSGVNIRLVDYGLHPKIFMNDTAVMVGSYKPDDITMKSFEDVFLMSRGHPQLEPLEAYVHSVMDESVSLGEELRKLGLSRDSAPEEIARVIGEVSLPKPVANPTSYREETRMRNFPLLRFLFSILFQSRADPGPLSE